jgi:hypothetical protein
MVAVITNASCGFEHGGKEFLLPHRVTDVRESGEHPVRAGPLPVRIVIAHAAAAFVAPVQERADARGVTDFGSRILD